MLVHRLFPWWLLIRSPVETRPTETNMQSLISRLPGRFQWTLHNMVAHPVMELLTQLGLKKWGSRFHDLTLPSEG